jgi:CHAT domain-containing protein
MSGCRAGAADAIASEGLLGLSRAWLAAGASSVLATQWPMPDDSGEMWDSF